MTHTRKEKSAGAIIFKKTLDGSTNYLLLHYESGHWEFAKGHVEKGETEEQTVEREVEEETGIKDLKIISGFRYFIKYFFKATYGVKNKDKNKAPLVFKTVAFFLAETNTEQIQLSPEHIGFKWLPYEEALNQLTHKNAKNILKKANDFLLSKK